MIACLNNKHANKADSAFFSDFRTLPPENMETNGHILFLAVNYISFYICPPNFNTIARLV